MRRHAAHGSHLRMTEERSRAQTNAGVNPVTAILL